MSPNNYLKLTIQHIICPREHFYYFHDGNKEQAQVALKTAQRERDESGLPSDPITVYRARGFGRIPGVKEVGATNAEYRRPLPQPSKFIGMPRGAETL